MPGLRQQRVADPHRIEAHGLGAIRKRKDAAGLVHAGHAQLAGGQEIAEADGHGLSYSRTPQASNSTPGTSARAFARFASRWSKVANPEARELRAICSASAKS